MTHSASACIIKSKLRCPAYGPGTGIRRLAFRTARTIAASRAPARAALCGLARWRDAGRHLGPPSHAGQAAVTAQPLVYHYVINWRQRGKS